MRRKLALLGGTSTWTDAAIATRLLLAGSPVDGPALPAYERAFAEATGTAHATSFATARLALYAILRSLGIGAGDEVLLQAPTHVVVSNAIRYTGARPVYVDCVRDNWNIDFEDAARKTGAATKVLVLQHTFGIPVDMDAAARFADEHGLILVEDCVHALGARWRGRPVGSFGRAAIFSTEETKVISTTMGGMAVTDDAALHADLQAFRASCEPPSRGLVARYLLKFIAYHLLTQPRLHRFTRAAYERLGERQPLPTPTHPDELEGGPRPGYEQRLGEAQARLGLRQLRRLDRNIAHRRATAERYSRLLEGTALPALHVPPEAEPSWVRFPIHVGDREAAVAALSPHAVVGTWFSSVLEEAVDDASGEYVPGTCPVAEEAARTLINLPTHERVRPADVDRMIGVVRCELS